MESLPIILVAPPGPQRDTILVALTGTESRVLDSPQALWADATDESGILVLGPGLSSEDMMSILVREAEAESPRPAVLVRGEGGEVRLRPVSVGPPMGTGALAEIALDPRAKGPVLELHWVLRVVARARHDLNNPLTSGLAEVQLLLMDEHPPEIQESLETIQEQFRRLRDMVADLSRLRVPRRDPEG